MKLISFTQNGIDSFGVIKGDMVVDLTSKFKGITCLSNLLEANQINKARDYCVSAQGDFHLSEIDFLPVIPNPSKIICLAINFKGHVLETGRDMPKYPVTFHRHAQTLTGHKTSLIRPSVSDNLDYEGELAVVLGKRGGNISVENAMDYVAGYTCFNEASIRDWQKHSHLYGMGKNFRGTGAVGPWMVTKDEIPNPENLVLTTLLNGVQMQQVAMDDLIFTIPEMIAYVSQALDWQPGDILVTGTPSGVGLFQKPPRFLRPGDQIEVSITEIGTLLNTVADQLPLEN
ncbi:MAG: hypothetical protein COA69_07090 [Robiginitomaculum sp.]|nr:MAG: hypothetical protein COA69_07090 [Robiginitomaculum sp.]